MQEEVQARPQYMPFGFNGLPPDCEVRNGRVMRRYVRTGENSKNEEWRVVSATIEEAIKTRTDYYDELRGWFFEGWKWQSDPADRGLDPFTGQRIPHYLTPEAVADYNKGA